MTKANKIFIIVLLSAGIISAIIYFFIPSLAEQGLNSTFAVTSLFTITSICAVWYFLSSLKSFKVGLKIAYYLLTAGIVFYSFILTQSFLLLFVDVSNNAYLQSGLFLVPYGLASFLVYLGMHKFAKLLEIKDIWTSFTFVLVVASIVAITTTQLPHPAGLLDASFDETTLDLLVGTLMWCTAFGACAAVVTLHVRRAINSAYKTPMAWMAVALAILAISALHEFIIKVYFFDSTYVSNDFTVWPFVLAGILFLRAGLAFKEAQKSLLLSDDASYIDIVSATAQLVSKPDAIDLELDKLRAIAAHTPDPKIISDQDKTTLKQLYLYLEDYLVNREPLAKFNREDLRESLPRDFAASLGHQISSDVFHMAK